MASITEVARAAGVSPTTVSHALSGKRPVSAETRERIDRAIRELDYRPNMIAASLRHQATRSIGLILVDIANPYYPALARAVQDTVSTDGYITLLANTDGVREAERRMLAEMAARRVDGVIMQNMSLTLAESRAAAGPDLALIAIADEPDTAAVDQVHTDDAQGIAEAVNHLLRRGITDIGFINGPAGRQPSVKRLDAFRAAMQQAGLRPRPDWITHSAFTRQGGAEEAARLLARADRPRALMCGNDLIAIGVLDAARHADLHVPDQLAVIGFDDIDTAQLLTPRLTTIRNPAAEVGFACANGLLARIADPSAPYRRTCLPTRLVPRDSA